MVMSHHCRHQFPGRLMRLQNWTQEGTAVAFFKIFQAVTPSSTVLPTSQGKKVLRASVFLKRHHTFPRQRLELAAAQFTYRADTL